MHHDPKPKDSDSEDDATVERKKPEGSWFPPQREKGLNTSEVSSVHVRVQYKYALFMKVNVTSGVKCLKVVASKLTSTIRV